MMHVAVLGVPLSAWSLFPSFLRLEHTDRNDEANRRRLQYSNLHVGYTPTEVAGE